MPLRLVRDIDQRRAVGKDGGLEYRSFARMVRIVWYVQRCRAGMTHLRYVLRVRKPSRVYLMLQSMHQGMDDSQKTKYMRTRTGSEITGWG